MIRYSKKAIKALSYFFRPYNDVDIYVEDTTCRNMWEILVNRILDGNAYVNRIFPLGGREEVVKACRNDQNASSRPRLYIIDGDLDILVGTKPPKLRHFYRLAAANVENLLFSGNALTELGCECATNCSAKEVEAVIAFESVSKELVRKLCPLFAVYGAASILDGTLQTVSYNVMRLCESGPGRHPVLSSAKVKKRMADLIRELQKAHPKREIEDHIARLGKKMSESERPLKYVSGKTHIMPWLHIYLKHKVGFDGDLKQLRTRLARHCTLDADAGLVKAVQKVSKGRG